MDDHDQSYRLLFAHPEMVRDLLLGFVPGEWVQELDFDSLEKMNGSYVTDDLRSRHADAIWRVKWGSQWLYVYLLLEFQSTVDRFMPVRILSYTGLLYQDLIRQKALSKGRKLPRVMPIVLYNGKSRWWAPTRVSDLVDSGPPGLELFQPDQAFLLLDEGAFDLDALSPLHNLVAALFRLEHQRSLEELTQVLGLLVDWLKAPDQASLRRAFVEWLRQRLRHWAPEAKIPEMHDLQEVHDMTQTMSDIWKEQYRQSARQEALQEGRQEGRREGRQEGEFSLLSRQLTRRFGPLPEATVNRLKHASLDELELWADRVLDAASLDEVLR